MAQQAADDSEFGLIDIFAVLIKRKWIIMGITGVAICFVVIYSVISLLLPPKKSYMPNVYTPKALMLINDSSSSGGGLSSLLNSSGLSSLASLAGASTSSSYSSLAVFLTGTNSFYDSIAEKFDLLPNFISPKTGKPNRSACRSYIAGKIKAKFDSESGVFSISFTDVDPVFAQSVTNYCVEYLEKRFEEMGIDKNKVQKQNLEVNIANTYKDILALQQESQRVERSVSMGSSDSGPASIMIEVNRIKMEVTAKESVYTQLKSQYELLKVSMASETPVFQVLEYAEVPDEKSGPSRGKLCMIVTFAAFFFSVLLSFVLDELGKLRGNSGMMAKIRGIK